MVINKSSISNYASQSNQQLLDSFQISLDSGLSASQIAEQKKQYGLNILKQHDVTWMQVLVRQLSSPFFFLLAGAAFLSFFLGEFLNGSMILIFIFINVVLSFYQEYHAEHTIKMLKNLIVQQTTVKRDGKEVIIPTSELVPGDIIFLEPGDILPADIRFLQAENLTIDEAILTGESVSVVKFDKPTTDFHEERGANNIGLSGTTVVTGKAVGIVVAIADNTLLGSVVQATQQVFRDSLFAHQIRKFSIIMLVVIIMTMGIIFTLHMIMKSSHVSVVELILFALSLTVSIVPEALPVVISFCLARGASRLAKNHVVVRRLSAIDDLGTIEVLCTDKTGTLTENKLAVVDVLGDKIKVLTAAILVNVKTVFDPHETIHSFDRAIMQALVDLGSPVPLGETIHYVPFNPMHLCTYALVGTQEGKQLVARGALEELIDRSILPSDLTRVQVEQWAKEQGLQARRVLMVAVKKISHDVIPEMISQEKDLMVVGLISFADEIKQTVAQTIKKAQQLGIQIKIMTGDTPEVAGVVAQHIGLIKYSDDVLTGGAFERMNEEQQKKAVNRTVP